MIAPQPQSYIRPAVAYLREHRKAQEPVYVIDRTTTTFLVYWGAPDSQIHLDVNSKAEVGDKRFWVIEKLETREGKPTLLIGASARHPYELRNKGSLVELCDIEGHPAR